MESLTKTPADKVREYASRANGSGQFFKHWLSGTIYTEGVLYMAETLGAHWLVDAIASHQPKVRRRLANLGLRDFQVWRLRELRSGGWHLECWTDIPVTSALIKRQRIEYSDFPLELAPFTLWVEGGTLMLPEER